MAEPQRPAVICPTSDVNSLHCTESLLLYALVFVATLTEDFILSRLLNLSINFLIWKMPSQPYGVIHMKHRLWGDDCMRHRHEMRHRASSFLLTASEPSGHSLPGFPNSQLGEEEEMHEEKLKEKCPVGPRGLHRELVWRPDDKGQQSMENRAPRLMCLKSNFKIIIIIKQSLSNHFLKHFY